MSAFISIKRKLDLQLHIILQNVYIYVTQLNYNSAICYYQLADWIKVVNSMNKFNLFKTHILIVQTNSLMIRRLLIWLIRLKDRYYTQNWKSLIY